MLGRLGIVHCFARSGGTLLNRLLGASAGVDVLSEVGPAASVRDPVDQAIDWLGLAVPSEASDLRSLPFAALIDELRSRADSRGAHLVVRDFPTPNYLPGAFGDVVPSGRPECAAALRAHGIDLAPLVLARRAAAVYDSLVRSFSHLDDTTVDEFAVAYFGYATTYASVPVVHYESLTSDPARELEKICRLLDVPYDVEALSTFTTFNRCTGDNVVASSRGAGRPDVSVLADRTDAAAYRAAAAHPLCQQADALFGFPPVDLGAGVDDVARQAAVVAGAYEAVLARTRAELVDARTTLAQRSAQVVDVVAGVEWITGELAGARSRVDQLTAALDDAQRELASVRRSWDRTTGELSRVEAIADAQRHQVERLLDQLG